MDTIVEPSADIARPYCKCHATKIQHLDWALAVIAAERDWARRNADPSDAEEWARNLDRGLELRFAAAQGVTE